jgi:hypothetical protein
MFDLFDGSSVGTLHMVLERSTTLIPNWAFMLDVLINTLFISYRVLCYLFMFTLSVDSIRS